MRHQVNRRARCSPKPSKAEKLRAKEDKVRETQSIWALMDRDNVVDGSITTYLDHVQLSG